MSVDRIAAALARTEAALARIEAAAAAVPRGGAGGARVVGLVNVHERLREQVSESLRELDDLLEQLDEQAAS